MLTPAIHSAYSSGVAQLSQLRDVELLARGASPTGAFDAQPALYRATAQAFIREPRMAEEIFGPASLIVGCRNFAEVKDVAESLDGQLTATVHADEADYGAASALLPLLERKAGRILFNDYPTGVEVSYAMVHGGPFPATSDSRTTSVGAAAISRFLRPLCYQDVPDALLPPSLQAANPLGIGRLVDGRYKES